jgi:butyryl-CoA dehydrogenase
MCSARSQFTALAATKSKSKNILPKAATGEYLGAFGLTEPNAGSDTAAIETTARLEGEHYILNGTKTFITSGASADFYIVMAKLLGEGEDKKGNITAFVVERGFEGFSIGQKFDMLGMRGYSTCEIVFNDCKVPKFNLLGAHGEGRKVALSSLAKGRVTIAAQSIGWAQGAIDACTDVLRRHYSRRTDYSRCWRSGCHPRQYGGANRIS